MALMLKSAERIDGQEQPSIKVGPLSIRIPLVHAPIEIPEIVQAAVVTVTGISATTYLEDLFGLPFSVALAIVCVHEIFYFIQNMLGDPLVGGWITPAVPLIVSWLTTYTDMTERIHALIWLQILLGLLYIVLGLTGLAAKIIDWVPNSVKAGILIGAGMSAVIGNYGFAAGGKGFASSPISFSIGVILSLFLLFSKGFDYIKKEYDKGIINFLAKAGFVPALLLAYVVGMLVGEIGLPSVNWSEGFFFNMMPGIRYTLSSFSLPAIGLPPMHIIVSAIPIAFMVYVISFGNIVAGTEFIREASTVRTDEKININPNLSNVMCGARNILQGLFFPTVVMSGPLWTAMMVTISERYKTGKKNMYSLFGGVITFNTAKAIFHFILPLIALVQPILPLAMSLTLMIQAFGSFYVALAMCKDNVQRGVAGLIGGILAITTPHIGLLAGVIVSIVVEFLFVKKEQPENIV